MLGIYLGVMAVLVVASFVLARRRAERLDTARRFGLHSRPIYHGLFTATAVFGAMFLVMVVGLPGVGRLAGASGLSHFPSEMLETATTRGAMLRDMISLARGEYTGTASQTLTEATATFTRVRLLGQWGVLGLGTLIGLMVAYVTLGRVGPVFRARTHFERVVRLVLMAAAAVAVATTIGIVLSVLFETLRFFEKVPPLEFLFGLEWSPQTAIRADQGGSSGAFGIVPLVTGTLLITLIAILVAEPIGLFCAVYLAEYASPRLRSVMKPVLEILAGVPTVVLGFFGALTVAPLLRGLGQGAGLEVASESALAAGLVMGMMIIPFVSSLSDDVITAVPQSLRDGSYALGATKSETITRVVLYAALPGIVSAMMLAISRAIGETMIVVMAAGLAANLTFDPLQAVTTFTVQIKTILVGDQEFDSAKTLAAFALGFVLFFFTLILNVIALEIVNKYREQYD